MVIPNEEDSLDLKFEHWSKADAQLLVEKTASGPGELRNDPSFWEGLAQELYLGREDAMALRNEVKKEYARWEEKEEEHVSSLLP